MSIKISRRSFVAGTVAAAVIGSSIDQIHSESNPTGLVGGSADLVHLPPRKLRGYGTLSATHRKMRLADGVASLTHITCDSTQKALLVQAKYLSDCTILGVTSEATLSSGSKQIPIRQTSGGGVIAVFSKGSDVVIFAADSKRDLAKLCSSVVPSSAPATDFHSRVQVPLYLNRFDKHGLLIYYGPGSTPPMKPGDPPYDFPSDIRFIQENGPLGFVIWSTPLNDDTGEGLNDEQSWDWVEKEMRPTGTPTELALDAVLSGATLAVNIETARSGLPPHINTSHTDVMLWLANRHRDQTMIKAPQYCGGYYGVAHDSAGVGQISWNAEEAEDDLLGTIQQTVKRFATAPNVVGWLEPHAETDEQPMNLFLEYGPVADRGFQKYLRETHGSISAVSARLYGDAGHVKSWDEIKAPEVAEFAGFGPQAIDLRGDWQVHYVPAPDGHMYTIGEARNLSSNEQPPTAPVPPEWYQPGFDDSKWQTLTAPGNDRMLDVPWSPLVYRRTIQISPEWRASGQKKYLYLWQLFQRWQDVTSVYINGKLMTALPATGTFFAYDITDALKSGSNLISMNLPRGIVCYRTYLSHDEPLAYPMLGPLKNALWADFTGWISWGVARQTRRGAEMIRRVDFDKPINYMAFGSNAGVVKKILMDHGGHYHDTGAMAGFYDEFPPLIMRGSELASSAEPGNAPPNPREIQAFFGRWLTEGLNLVHYFGNLGDLIWNDSVLPIFLKNKTMYEAVGKYHYPFSDVTMLHSTRNDLLTSQLWGSTAEKSNGGYWRYNHSYALQRYAPMDAITEEDFPAKNAARYKIIIDTNTMFVTDQLMADIEEYVRGGGVFVTFGQTGRHTEVEPDTWPISKLTGYELVDPNPAAKGLSLQPAPNQKVFVSDFWKVASRTNGMTLKKVAPDSIDLMNWSDGSVAVGMRKIGDGYIVHMGSESGDGDPPIVTIFEELVTYFGAKRIPGFQTGTSGGLHMKHYIGNTGLNDFWVMFNESDSGTTTDLKFLPNVHPSALTDIITGEAATIERDPDGDIIRNIQLAPMQTIMWTSPRADIASSPMEWLTVQRGWWQGTKELDPAKPLPTAEQMQRFSMDLSRDWTWKSVDGMTDDQAATMMQPNVDDSSWIKRDVGQWTQPTDSKLRRSVMRKKFTVPAHWTSGKTFLCMTTPGGIFVDRGRIFIDGLMVHPMSNDGTYLDPVGDVLKPGTSHVLSVDILANGSLAGMRCPVWIYYLPDPQARQDLAGDWMLFSDALTPTGPQTLPGAIKGRYATKSVSIDESHKNQNVVVYVETTRPCDGILINGSLIIHQFYWGHHWFAININPFVKFGEENLLELKFSPDPNGTLFSQVEIRYYDKDEYP